MLVNGNKEQIAITSLKDLDMGEVFRFVNSEENIFYMKTYLNQILGRKTTATYYYVEISTGVIFETRADKRIIQYPEANLTPGRPLSKEGEALEEEST